MMEAPCSIAVFMIRARRKMMILRVKKMRRLPVQASWSGPDREEEEEEEEEDTEMISSTSELGSKPDSEEDKGEDKGEDEVEDEEEEGVVDAEEAITEV